MSSTTKALEPAFQGAGQKLGTEIWRIENFLPVALPKSDYGRFYSGDLYIILQTSRGRGGAYLYDIHFWLGKDTSQDEARTAAIKTVDLDTILGERAVQYRELQGHESDKFLSYFKPCIIELEGGVASGFKKPEEEEFETRLYICKAKRVVRLKQVSFSRSSLNHDDVFILDTKDKIFQFNGANSIIQERAKSLEVIQFLKEKYHEGKCDVAIVDDGKLQAESDSGEFWVIFGGFAPIGKKVASEDDVIPDRTAPKLYSISTGQVVEVDGELSKSLLENNKCFLLDCGAEVFVWIGRVTQVDDRTAAIQAAEEFIGSQNRPKSTRVTRLIQGYETNTFKSKFDSWPSGSAPEEGRGKVAALLKQQGVGLEGASKSSPVNEEIPPLLEGGGKTEVWRINGSAKTPVPKEDIGKFYGGDCYIVVYTYHPHYKEDYYLCYWIGKESVEEDQKMAARLVVTMSNSLNGRPVQARIYQGKEPPQFIAIFHPMVVLKGGISSGYKNYIADNGLNDETYNADCVALIEISGTAVHHNKAVQVDAVATSLNTNECFIVQSGSSVFVWNGSQSTVEQQQLAIKVADFLKPGAIVKIAKEGTENSSFWFALGGKDKSNGTNQGGPTQRASALAALNSAFSSSPGPKRDASPKSAGVSRGSQRAAAVAALSSVLTVEKKGSPDSFPVQSSKIPSTEPMHSEMARVNEELSLTVKWNGKDYNFVVSPNDSIRSLKYQIWEATKVRVIHQKLLYPKIGLIRNDFQLLSNVPIRTETKMIMIGTVEDDIFVDSVEGSNDFDVDSVEGSNDFVDIKGAMISKKNLERHINDSKHKIRVLHQCRTSTKLLVLDVDCTILDHRSREPMRPGLHEFLSAVYADYDIIIWSSSSMNWAQLKLKQVGVLNNPSYKITAILDRFAMITVRHDSGSFFDCKPLCLIWNWFPEFYKPSNTIVIDDLRRNFVMNPQNGLMIRRFRKAHARQADEELSKLAEYLLAIVGLDDFSQLDHRKWEMYPIYKEYGTQDY